MKKSKTLIFFGNERLATGLPTEAPVMRALISEGYHIAAVVVAQNKIESSRKAKPNEIAIIAGKHNIPVLSPPKLIQIKDILAEQDATAGILVAYGKMIPQNIIDIFPRGIINIHPSLLPKHRGPTPIESTILYGDKVAGVSLMQLSANMDAGPVYAQESVYLNGNETKSYLAKTLINIGKDMLINNLPNIINGSLVPIPQNDEQATYDSLIDKSAGLIDTLKTADILTREIRAYSEWPKSRITIGDIDTIITKANVADKQLSPGKIIIENKKLLIGTAIGSLEIIELMPLGKQKMSATAFINGYRNHIL